MQDYVTNGKLFPLPQITYFIVHGQHNSESQSIPSPDVATAQFWCSNNQHDFKITIHAQQHTLTYKPQLLS